MTILAATRRSFAVAGLALAAFVATPLAAQEIEQVDPNAYAIDGDLAGETDTQATDAELPADTAADTAYTDSGTSADYAEPVVTSSEPSYAASQAASEQAVAAAQGDTYKEDDLIGAAEGVFGKGAEGVARMIEDILSKQGEPNGYIVGREAGGAFVVGARYGSGTLFHKVEGQKPVYWTGPSVGFDAGANAGSTFVLVYNLHDTEELYERYPAGEGSAYLVGGLNASYLRKGDVVLIPIRVGAGLRLGVYAGYMRFSKKQRWLPF